MIIHAYDPGGTTGYAIYNNVRHSFFAAGDFPYMDGVGKFDLSVQPDLVIIESFRLYSWKANNKKWSGFPEVEVIGALKYWCREEACEWIEQPASVKQLFDDAKLKKLNLWNGYSRHCRDAMRHVLYYVTVGGDNYWLNQL